MLDHIIKQTKAFLEEMPKSKRKKIGQFFTSKETAEFMANMFDLENVPSHVDVLDPGAGTGILSAALLERLSIDDNIDSINLICYENDPVVIPILKKNLELISSLVDKKFTYEVRNQDYLLSQSYDFEGTLLANKNPQKYDLIIGNPPYLRVLRNNPAALALPSIVHGAPNLYFLFAAMSLFNLKSECEMVYIIPRSWTSGAYFKAFRDYFLNNGKLQHIHLFVSRDKVFSEESVLQETIIIKHKKTTNKNLNVKLTSSKSNNDFNELTELNVPYTSVVTGEDLYVFLPTCEKDIETICKINRYNSCMPEYGFRMKTGIVVDFRQYDDLREENEKGTVPLFYSQHIRDGRVNHDPSGKDFDWIIDSKQSLIQKNKNYIFCKRFTAKEERRRLQCGIYLSEDFAQFSHIGTQNKINFIDRVDKSDFSLEMIYGLYALFNSTLFDQYYRILNGSTQVNSTEINSIPVPPPQIIERIGELILKDNDLSTEQCDKIIEEIAYE